MKIILNGKPQELGQNLHLKNLIDQFCKDTRHVIAEVNGTIVKSNQWEQKSLTDGDTIELINFVGGG